ncbi:PREDICTED: protein canopy homolog 2 isoform X2 [Chinchilla lanigera]|uniref:protein canopy homolog 2 isoform X2 n=1 Tax=Chinchilla lanigera TaxID=34839 RepID=UPI00038F0359|nr:PREDICTED: protein canopy homolog 2 isoform X2 [Chinchilla lanigera]
MKSWGWLALLLGALLGTVWARRSQDLHCGACRALVDELEWEIAQVDPKKTIQMGSFRINPDGSQSVVEVPYARSEAHLTELLEEVCDRMKEYGEQIDPSTHRKNYVRVVSRSGESSERDLQGIRIDSDISGTLKFVPCGTWHIAHPQRPLKLIQVGFHYPSNLDCSSLLSSCQLLEFVD